MAAMQSIKSVRARAAMAVPIDSDAVLFHLLAEWQAAMAAHDALAARVDDVDGDAAAEAALDAAFRPVWSDAARIEAAVADAPAQGFGGLLVKATIANRYAAPDVDGVERSLWEDIMRLGAGD